MQGLSLKPSPHALIQGIETTRSAYYPVRMVESIVTSPDFVEHPNLAECDVKWTQRLQALPAEEVLPPVPDDLMLICLTAMTLLYLKLLNIGMVSLKKIDKLGMANCSTITVQQDTPRTRTWFTCFAMLDFPSGRSKLLEIFDAIACDRLLQHSKSSGEVPRATTHPWCKAWETRQS